MPDLNFGSSSRIVILGTITAVMNGLYPKKGDLMLGSDADVVIVDMDMPFHIKGENLQTIQKSTPYEDMKGKGMPVITLVRGKVVYEDGQVIGDFEAVDVSPATGDEEIPLLSEVDLGDGQLIMGGFSTELIFAPEPDE